MNDVKGVFLDIDGVILQGQQLIAGSDDAVNYLRKTVIPLRFLTNTTRRTKQQVLDTLNSFGLEAAEDELITAPTLAREFLQENDLRPYLLIHEDLKAEFAGLSSEKPNAVVVGDAEHNFNYEHLNHAFRLLQEGALLVAMGKSRYFRDSDGKNSLDAGPFVKLLEYATQTSAVLLGKPSQTFFHMAVESMGFEANEVVLIGDDVETDCNAAIELGFPACLVKTGKYQPGDEQKLLSGVSNAFENLKAAVNKMFVPI